MARLVRSILVVAFLMLLAGCRITVGVPDVPTAVVPPSATPPHGDILNPVGVPLSEWGGIPVMPQAIAGQNYLDGSYSYTVHAGMDEAQDYYLRKLAARGWQAVDGRFVEKGDSFVGIFEKEGNIVNITIRPGPGVEGKIIVILHIN